MRKHDLRAAYIGLDRPDRAFDNQLYAYRRGKVIDHVAQVNEFGHQMIVRHRIQVIMEARQSLDPIDVLHRAGRKIVNDIDLVAAFEVAFGEVRSDEAGSARNQYFHYYSFFKREINHEETKGANDFLRSFPGSFVSSKLRFVRPFDYHLSGATRPIFRNQVAIEAVNIADQPLL